MTSWSSIAKGRQGFLLFAGTAILFACLAYSKVQTLPLTDSAKPLVSQPTKPSTAEQPQSRSNATTRPHEKPCSSDGDGVPDLRQPDQATLTAETSEGENETKAEGGQEDVEEEQYDELVNFRATMADIDFQAAENLAMTVRLAQQKVRNEKHSHTLTCTIDRDPMYGTFNLVYVIEWSDDIKWVMRIPGHATTFDAVDVSRMSSEYGTMQYLRRNTSIPIPEVFRYETSSTSIGVPFAFMSFAHGKPLYDYWLDPNTTEEKRYDLLSSVAGYMAQLHQHSFTEIGILHFDQDGQPDAISPMIERAFKSYEGGLGFNCQYGPYKSMKTYLSRRLEAVEYVSVVAEAADPIMQMAIDSIPDFLDNTGCFFLSPSDLDWQNVLVDNDGKITAIIDWDNVSTKPSAFGCARYPAWISRDWATNLENHEDYQGGPDMLLPYRRHYAAAFAGHRMTHYDARATKVSHILEAIEIALLNRMAQGYILVKLLDHAFGERDRRRLMHYANDYVDDNTAEMDVQIRSALARMWQVEMGKLSESSDEDCQ